MAAMADTQEQLPLDTTTTSVPVVSEEEEELNYLRKVTLDGVNFMESALAPDTFVSVLRSEKQAKEVRKKIYAKANRNLNLVQLSAVVLLLDRLLLYVGKDAEAFAEGVAAKYPKTTTNLDFTIKTMWKENLKASFEKYLSDSEFDMERANPYDFIYDHVAKLQKSLGATLGAATQALEDILEDDDYA